MDRRKYPKDWPAISRAVREAAGQRCEWPGCGARNGSIVQRKLPSDRILAWWPEPCCETETALLEGARLTRIVLTVAHVDHDTTNNDRSNLRAWCQLHHLRWDAQHHAKNAASTRSRKRRAERLAKEVASQPLFKREADR